ncbi:MAG: M48 family metallopeptidase [Bacteroidales bacterium]|nr:M48 family metallopeptidase [Bacteroidales bacterium]
MAGTYKLKRYTLTHEGLIISVKEYKTSRRMRVIVHRDGSVSITCPPRTSKFAVGDFVLKSMEWIRNAVKRMQSKPAPASTFITSFKSRGHELEYQAHEKNLIKVEFSGKIILVKYPKTLDICSTQVQQAAYKAIVMALKKEAAEHLPERLRELASANNLSYRSLSITSTRTRWGSCNMGKDIRISCFVMMLTDELIDLVLLHELAHTVYMNHGEAFHLKLNSMLPLHNERELDKKLRNYNITKPK